MVIRLFINHVSQSHLRLVISPILIGRPLPDSRRPVERISGMSENRGRRYLIRGATLSARTACLISSSLQLDHTRLLNHGIISCLRFSTLLVEMDQRVRLVHVPITLVFLTEKHTQSPLWPMELWVSQHSTEIVLVGRHG